MNNGNNQRIWIQQDMNGSSYKIYKKALDLKKKKKIDNVFFNSGRIFIKEMRDTMKIEINDMAELEKFK